MQSRSSRVRSLALGCLLALPLILTPRSAAAQFRVLETEDLTLVYHDLSSDFLVRQAARSYENTLREYADLFGYRPSDPVTLFLHDGSDYGNASADVIPRNRIMMALAPLSYWYETAPANERLNSTIHHEMVHVAANDAAAGRDQVFRKLFMGKVSVSDRDPVSILYSYLTAPRRYAPRWYQEGIAVYMETWLSGQGRTLGGYDEMMFRTAVRDDRYFYDVVGLESEGTTVDFQVGVNSYLYGTRFMSWLAVTYGPESVIKWFYREAGSKAHFTSQFKHQFGLPLEEAWESWIAFEHDFQRQNLERVRANPITSHQTLAARPLGSMSRSFVDPETGRLLAGVNYPGKLAHIAAIDMQSGDMQKLTGIRGPSLYTVTSLAFDAPGRTLFYSVDNSRWRDLRAYDLATGKSRTLMKNERIGDLVFNPADRSLWGVRHFLGLSTLVRIPEPYTRWEQVLTLDYGTDIYDMDISPDGSTLTAARVTIDGRQRLVAFDTEALLAGQKDFRVLFDFQYSNPESFVFTPDGSGLVGSSYYSGVSNIYRIDLESGRTVALTNAETGYFRPQVLEDGRLLAFDFTADGFQPVIIEDTAAKRVASIAFLGDEIVRDHPIVRDWLAPPPSRIDLDEVGYTDSEYDPGLGLQLASAYPIVQGYRGGVAAGVRMDFSDPIFLHEWVMTVSASVDPDLPDDERLHAGLTYRHRGLELSGQWNNADFYDLFGPTQRSRRGTALRATYGRSLAWEGPKRSLSWEVGAAGFFRLRTLPQFQNVAATSTRMGQAHAGLSYHAYRSSLGAVDNESGVEASVTASSNMVAGEILPSLDVDAAAGALLLPHVSLWIRQAAGVSTGDADNPFAKSFFGGFRNNWVDRSEIKQFRNPLAFPGLDIDAIGGQTWARSQAELMLPPIRFRHAGSASLYLKWIRPTVFGTVLWTDPGQSDRSQRAVNAGAQLDLRIMLFSYLRTTLSAGWARAKWGERTFDEAMISLKIL